MEPSFFLSAVFGLQKPDTGCKKEKQTPEGGGATSQIRFTASHTDACIYLGLCFHVTNILSG